MQPGNDFELMAKYNHWMNGKVDEATGEILAAVGHDS